MGPFDLTSVADVRAEGLTTSEASNGRVAMLITLAGTFIRQFTGQVFWPVTYTADAPLLVDGTAAPHLPLPMPVLELLTVAEDDSAVALDSIAVYSRAIGQDGDERFYPRLVLKGGIGGLLGGIVPTYGRMSAARWERGFQNVSLTGTFGFLDGVWKGTWSSATTYAPGDAVVLGLQSYLAIASSTNANPSTDDGTHWQVSAAPTLIRRCAIDLVLREYRLKNDPDYAQATQKGRVTSETTDGHSYTLAGLVASPGLTGDPNIDDVLSTFTRRYGGNTSNPGQ